MAKKEPLSTNGFLAQGYLVQAAYDDGVLTVRGRNKFSTAAASGQHFDDLDEEAIQAKHDEEGAIAASAEALGDIKGQMSAKANDDVVLRRDQIADIDFKKATPVVNGRLTITTTTGDKHVLHFRRKQTDAFVRLCELLGDDPRNR
jgi:hypothetical protein